MSRTLTLLKATLQAFESSDIRSQYEIMTNMFNDYTTEGVTKPAQIKQIINLLEMELSGNAITQSRRTDAAS